MHNPYAQILRLEKQLEKMAEIRLLNANRQVQQKQTQIDQLDQQRSGILQQLNESPQPSVASFQNQQVLWVRFEQELARAEEELEQLKIEAAKLAQAKATRSQRREGIENLNEQFESNYQQQQDRTQQLAIHDQLLQVQHARTTES